MGEKVKFSRQRFVTLLCGPVFAMASHAAPITTNFSDHAGLANGSGTSSTISQNGIRLQALEGRYEVTYFPEVNLKDFDNGSRVIQIDLEGEHFDFLGFSIRDLSRRGVMTLTSDRGGEAIIGQGFQSITYSGEVWEDLDWVRFTFTGRFTEAKFTSFTLDDEATVANTIPAPGTLALMGLALGLLGVTRRHRG